MMSVVGNTAKAESRVESAFPALACAVVFAMPGNLSHDWTEGPQKPTLSQNQVDVWRLRLDDPQFDRPSLSRDEQSSVLAPDELARAARFHFDKDRIRFTRCRTALRELLSRYLAISSGDIRFTYSTSGKPELHADQNSHGLRFNVSHSGNVALIAIGLHNDLGVDIEKVRLDVNTTELSERFFSARERESLRSLPETLRVGAFYACWARKEAFLKAIGEGLGFPLSDFSVSVHPETPPRIEEIEGDANAVRSWSLADVYPAADFRSALATKSAALTIATFQLSI